MTETEWKIVEESGHQVWRRVNAKGQPIVQRARYAIRIAAYAVGSAMLTLKNYDPGFKVEQQREYSEYNGLMIEVILVAKKSNRAYGHIPLPDGSAPFFHMVGGTAPVGGYMARYMGDVKEEDND